MRVLILASYAPSIWLFRCRLVNDMLGKGIDVSVAVPCNAQEREKLEGWGLRVFDVPLQRRGMNPWHDARYVWALHRVFRRVRPEKALAYTIKPIVYGSFLSAWHRCEFYAIVTGLGVVGNAQGVLGRVLRTWYRASLQRSKSVFFQNEDDRRDLGFASGFGHLIPGSGVDLDFFKKRSFPPPKPFKFLFAGRFVRSKGIVEYLEAARILKERYRDRVVFFVAGWDDEGKDSVPSAWIKRHKQIVFLGKVDDMRDALAKVHVFVLPSYREGTPRSVLEAMATGRPVITTNTPGCRETLLPGRNGWLVPPRDVPRLVRAMEEALASSLEDLKRMGDASRKLAEERFDAAVVSRKILDGMGLC